VITEYARFFGTAATAAAGFTGLLFVALSVVNRDEHRLETRERRTVLAGSAFLALADIFFVSLTGTFGGIRALAAASLVMAMVGALGTSRLMPRARRAGNFAPGFPKRRLNIAFAAVAAGVYATQLGLAIALLGDVHSRGLLRALVFVLVALFVSALARGWEVAGIGHRGVPGEELPPLVRH
jgi:hypothetical protein